MTKKEVRLCEGRALCFEDAVASFVPRQTRRYVCHRHLREIADGAGLSVEELPQRLPGYRSEVS